MKTREIIEVEEKQDGGCCGQASESTIETQTSCCGRATMSEEKLDKSGGCCG